MNPQVEKRCNCHLLEAMAERAQFPIRHCSRNKIFELVHSNGDGRWKLSYCFECGGKLPEGDESWRAVPDPREQAEAEAVMLQAASVDDIVSILGPPDEILPWVDVPVVEMFEELADRYPDQYAHARKWTQCLRYSRRWPSILLDIIEFEDGTFKHTIWEQNSSQ